MKGGGVSCANKVFWRKKSFKNHLESLPDCQNIISALYYIDIVVGVTLNRAEYASRRSQQPKNVNFEPIKRGLKSDIFDWDQVLNPFHICRIQLQKKKSGVKKSLEILPLRGGVGPLMANAIKNFHFDFLKSSLK